MVLRDFNKSIYEALTRGIEAGLSDWQLTANPSSLKPDEEFNRVLLNPLSMYQDSYKEAIRLNYYNFMLFDDAFFQFSYREGENGAKIRLAYYPPPFISNEKISEFKEEPELLDQLFDEATLLIDKPPIRYDLDFENHMPCKHPTAHLHVGAFSKNRWPVRVILSPETFSLFIYKHYYPEPWYGFEKCTVDSDFDNDLDHKYASALARCTQLDSVYFTDLEKRHLSLG